MHGFVPRGGVSIFFKNRRNKHRVLCETFESNSVQKRYELKKKS